MAIISLLPELILSIGALIILMIDVFFGKKFEDNSRVVLVGAFSIALSALFAVIYNYGDNYSVFGNAFAINKFTSYSKIAILILLISVVILSTNFSLTNKRISAEFIALIFIATTGSMLLISSNDLLPFYLSLELQSLSLYILACIKRDSGKSSEAGIKYFILGSVSSGILLLGISFVYGFTGTTNFETLFSLIEQYYRTNAHHAFDNSLRSLHHGLHHHYTHHVMHSHMYGLAHVVSSIAPPIGLLLGLTLVFIAILFKVAAAPFHMWAPDVYEGAPTNITAFFASTIKFAMILVAVKVYIYSFHAWVGFNQILILVAVLSLLVGCLGALKQNNLKRMLAYSGIGHVGFIIAGLSSTNFESLKAVILYASIYGTLSVGSFALLILMINKNDKLSEDDSNDEKYQLSSLAGIGKSNPVIAAFLAILMLSMAGIPPMAGFFAKFYILLSIIKAGYVPLAVLAVMTSIISAFYYLRIIKIMYFDEKSNKDIAIESDVSPVLVLFAAAMFNLLFLAFINPFLDLISKIFF